MSRFFEKDAAGWEPDDLAPKPPNQQPSEDRGVVSAAALQVWTQASESSAVKARKHIETIAGTRSPVEQAETAASLSYLSVSELRAVAERLADDLNIGFFQFSPRMEYARLSKGMAKALGLENITQLTPAQVEAAIHPDDVDRSRVKFGFAAIEGQPYQDAYRIVLPNGRIRYQRTYGRPLFDDKGGICAVEGYCLDETELQTALQTAEQNRALIENFIASCPAPVAMLDKNQHYVLTSPLYADLFRVVHHYRGREGLMLPGMPSIWREAFQQAISSGAERDGIEKVELPNRGEKWLRWRMRPWNDMSGEAAGAVLFVEDMTPLMNALEQSQYAEERLELALQIADCAVFEVDLANPKVILSANWRELVGHAPSYDDFANRRWPHAHPEDEDSIREAWGDGPIDNAVQTFKHRVVRPSGEQIWVSASVRCVHNDDGVIIRIIGLLRELKEEALEARPTEGDHLSGAAQSSQAMRSVDQVLTQAEALSETQLDPEQRRLVQSLLDLAIDLRAQLRGEPARNVAASPVGAGELVLIDDSEIPQNIQQADQDYLDFERFDESDLEVLDSDALPPRAMTALSQPPPAAPTDVGEPVHFEGEDNCLIIEDREPPGAAHLASPSAPLDQLRILLVQDNPAQQKLIRLVFEELDVSCACVSDPLIAIDQARLAGWDAVFIDMQIRGIGGLNALKAMRADEHAAGRRRLPIFAIMSNARQEQIAECVSCGADGHLAAPLNKRSIAQKLAVIALEKGLEQPLLQRVGIGFSPR